MSCRNVPTFQRVRSRFGRTSKRGRSVRVPEKKFRRFVRNVESTCRVNEGRAGSNK